MPQIKMNNKWENVTNVIYDKNGNVFSFTIGNPNNLGEETHFIFKGLNIADAKQWLISIGAFTTGTAGGFLVGTPIFGFFGGIAAVAGYLESVSNSEGYHSVVADSSKEEPTKPISGKIHKDNALLFKA